MKRILIVGLVVLTACSDTNYGALRARVVEGREQTVVAGSIASKAVNLSYREALAYHEPAWKRWTIPAAAYAQTSSQIRVAPGAVACVREDQSELIPTERCVTADAQGNSRYDWLTTPIHAGEYCARVSTKLGLEQSQVDSVCVTVVAGALDSILLQNWGLDVSPAKLAASAVSDKHGNPIPFRIVSDGRLTVQGDVVGTDAARTVTFNASMLDTATLAWHGPIELRGIGDTLKARGWYQILIAGSGAGQPAIGWRIRGINLTGP
jgi:hypothetical protein